MKGRATLLKTSERQGMNQYHKSYPRAHRYVKGHSKTYKLAVSEAFEAGQLQIPDPLDAISKACAVTHDLHERPLQVTSRLPVTDLTLRFGYLDFRIRLTRLSSPSSSGHKPQ
jgi:hypothetical protein